MFCVYEVSGVDLGRRLGRRYEVEGLRLEDAGKDEVKKLTLDRSRRRRTVPAVDDWICASAR